MGMAVDSPIKEFVFPEGLSSPNAIAVDSENRVWFTEKVGKNLSMFDPEKEEFRVYPIPSSWGNLGPSRIALSPDGEVWFTVHRWAEGAADTNIVGRFTPSDGSFKRYIISTKATPEELLADKNGFVWFLAPDENKLYRFNPEDSSLKGLLIPTLNSYPRGLMIDKKGNIWFAEANANKIGFFSPERSEFDEYEIPTSFSNPGDIAVDSMGRIWFTELNTDRLGMLSPDSWIFNEAIIPTSRSLPISIVADRNGNIWFLEYRGNKVGVFHPVEAAFREFDIPTFNSLPGEMAIDPERGILWFSETDTQAKRLGMLSIKDALMEKKDGGAASKESPVKPSVEGSSFRSLYAGVVLAVFMIAVIGIFVMYSRRGAK